MIKLKWLVPQQIPKGTRVLLNDKGRKIFQDKPFQSCIGLITSIDNSGNVAKVVFPGVQERPVQIHRRYLTKVVFEKD